MPAPPRCRRRRESSRKSSLTPPSPSALTFCTFAWCSRTQQRTSTLSAAQIPCNTAAQHSSEERQVHTRLCPLPNDPQSALMPPLPPLPSLPLVRHSLMVGTQLLSRFQRQDFPIVPWLDTQLSVAMEHVSQVGGLFIATATEARVLLSLQLLPPRTTRCTLAPRLRGLIDPFPLHPSALCRRRPPTRHRALHSRCYFPSSRTPSVTSRRSRASSPPLFFPLRPSLPTLPCL